MEENKEVKEVMIDFEGKSNEGSGDYERVVVKDDVYTSKILSLEVQDTPKYGTSITEKTVIAKLEPLAGKGTIPFFIKPKITKAYNEKVSNSKLYDLLEKAGLLDIARNRKDELSTLSGLAIFLQQNFVGQKIKYLTKTRKQGTPEAYSSVDRVLEFIKDETEPVSKEVVVEEKGQ